MFSILQSLIPVVLLSLSLLQASVAYAEKIPTTSISTQTQWPIELGTQMLYLEDADDVFTLEQVNSGELAFQKVTKPSPNFGFTDSAYWFKFSLENQKVRLQDILIEIPMPFLDDVTVWQYHNDQLVKKHRVGDKFEFDKRPYRHPNLVTPFTLEPGTNVFLLRFQSEGTIEATMNIWDPIYFSDHTYDTQLLHGMWIGVLFIMVIYNLFLYFSIGDSRYLAYVGYVFGYMMFEVTLDGFSYAYLWPNLIEWNHYSVATFIAFADFCATILTIQFLNLKETSKGGFYLMSTLAAISGITLLMSFFAPYNITIRLSSFLVVPNSLCALAVGYQAWWRGDRFAKHFCLGWTAAFITTVVYLAEKTGFAPSNFWTNNAAKIGAVMLVSLLSFALASRFNKERNMRIAAQSNALHHEKQSRLSQQQALMVQEEANRTLEQKVHERTTELSEAMGKLEAANKELKYLSTTDALTGLNNRSFFEQQYHNEFKRAVRYGKHLTVILCDIDHFKQINDTYGHSAGDTCLRLLGELFKTRIVRAGDIAARYGGEEFIIMLTDTRLEEALNFAELLRQGISKLEFEHESQTISVTASLGIATLEDSYKDSDALINAADKALYQAKHDGRNQVVCV